MDMTQWLGVVAFGIAGITCLACLRPFWIALGIANLYFCIDIALNLRHRFRSVAIEAMGSFYDERGPWQIALFVIAAALGVFALAFALRVSPDKTTRMALTATVMSAGLFVMEIVSLHDVDAVLYHLIGPALLIGWMWLLFAAATAFAAGSAMKKPSHRG